jgi:hypothetical protein
MLRQLWSLVENTQAATLVSLDDKNLVQWLIEQLKTNTCLSQNETNRAMDYIQSRISLIRDLAEERLSADPSG